MPLLVTASSGYREIAPVLDSSVERGQQTTRRWRGLYAELLAASPSIGGITQRLEQEDDVWWVLNATFAGWPDSAGENPTYPDPNSQITHLWSLQGSRVAKSIWDLPVVRAELERLRDRNGPFSNIQGVANLRSDLQALARGDVYKITAPEDAEHGNSASSRTTWLTWKGVLSGIQGTLDVGVITELFSSLSNGVESYSIDAFVLRRRSVAPNGANLAPVYADTNRAFRTASLTSSQSIPALIQSNLPDGYWFKGAPVVDQTDANRYEVVQDWTWVMDFDRFVYGAPI